MVVRKGSWFLFEILSDEAEEGNVFAWVSIEVRWFSELRVFAGRNFRLIRRESRRLSRKRVRKKSRLKFPSATTKIAICLLFACYFWCYFEL